MADARDERLDRAGDELAFNYKLYWQNDEPNPPVNIGRVVSTHTGDGGVPGVPHTISENKRKFVIDFAGGPLATMEQRFDVKLPAGRASSIGGLLVELAGRIPAAGERFLLQGLEIDVLAASPARVERLLIRQSAPPPVTLGQHTS